MKVIIIYQSKTGFTEKYAKWMASELECRCMEITEAKKENLKEYDVILFGGGFFGGKIRGISWLKAQLQTWQDKRVGVFATGASAEESQLPAQALRQNFTDEEWKRIKAFYLRSGISYERMGKKERLVMAIFSKMMKGRKDKSEDEQGMADAIGASFDCTNRKKIEPIIAWVKGEDL